VVVLVVTMPDSKPEVVLVGMSYMPLTVVLVAMLFTVVLVAMPFTVVLVAMPFTVVLVAMPFTFGIAQHIAVP
jgi:hypothetical protein